ncbi:MAG TPA: regulatory signaling modulator protein AmpE [Gammaproteobacteria bacterium]
MALIAILLSLTLERLLGSLEGLRNFRWFTAWSAWLRRQLPEESAWGGAAGVVLLLLPPLLALSLLLHLLDDLWMPLSFLVGVLVLLYSIGPKDLGAEVDAFIAARERDDEEAAQWHAQALLGKELPDSSRRLTQMLMENILAEVNRRLVAVFFWFAVLGPFGALLYRLATLLHDSEREHGGGLIDAAARLLGVLDWLPARLCAVGYAMSGNFVESIQGWRDDTTPWPESNRALLLASGLGALGHVEENAEREVAPERETARINDTMALVRRMVLVLLALLALLTLGGWAS